jgi:hypothetical protein
VLMCTLKQMQITLGNDPVRPTDLPYAMSGHGVMLAGLGLDVPIFGAAGRGNHPSDMEMYVLLLAAEYILTTRDTAMLHEQVTYYNSTSSHTVLQALCQMARFSVRVVGSGPHGLMRMLTSDWDDGLGPPDAALNVSESVLNAAIATYALPRFAAALRLAGVEARLASELDVFVRNQTGALLSNGWDPQSSWLRRAWLGDKEGWVGGAPGTSSNPKNAGMYSPQHGFALLGGVFADEPAKQAASVAALAAHCRDGWPYGSAYNCDQKGTGSEDSGEGPGMWPALTYPLSMGLANAGLVEKAWEEFTRNSLHWQATVTPRQWAGIWTSADEVSADGGTGPVGRAYPAFCMHRHAWPIVAAAFLAGVRFNEAGLLLRPSLPLRLGAMNWTTATASMHWDPRVRRYTGHYTPRTPAPLRISVDLSLRHPSNTTVALTVALVHGRCLAKTGSRVEVGAEVGAGARTELHKTTRLSADLWLDLPCSTRLEFEVLLLE